jgi:hypothetical protein
MCPVESRFKKRFSAGIFTKTNYPILMNIGAGMPAPFFLPYFPAIFVVK